MKKTELSAVQANGDATAAAPSRTNATSPTAPTPSVSYA